MNNARLTDDALAEMIQQGFGRYELPITALPVRPRPRASRRVAPLLALPVAALAIALVATQAARPPSAFASWSAMPTLADPALAIAAQSLCLRGTTVDAPLAVQDQRGSAAALLFVNSDTAVMCVVALDSNGQALASSASATHLTNASSAFGLDGVGRSTPHGGSGDGLTRVFGHVPNTISSVQLSLSDGTIVTATIAKGRFLAWWPSGTSIASMTGVDGSGTVISQVTKPEASIGG
jgi:hypothetical protein